MTHDDGQCGNVMMVANELKELNKGLFFNRITRADVESAKKLGNIINFFIVKPYQLARAKIILMDNVFLPMAYIKVRKNVKVVQLWHGTGTIKKFGQDVNTGKLKVLEERANRNITHLIVNNEITAGLYAKAFNVSMDRVYPAGLPKTDDILNRIRKAEKTGINTDREKIYGKYNIPEDKKLILYAPTFRDENLSSDGTLKQLENLAGILPDNYVLGIRLHPFVARLAAKKKMQHVYDFSEEKELSALIMASDVLVTDYSSIIFEYCITEKPMIFFAYDLEEFSDRGRGFYENYMDYVPGPVARTADEVISIIKEERYSPEKIRAFNEINFPLLDGMATRRIAELILS